MQTIVSYVSQNVLITHPMKSYDLSGINCL